jgi:hypothetical protein
MTTVQFQLGGTLKFMVEEDNVGYVFFTITYDQFTITARGKDMAYKLPNDKVIKVQVSYVDSKGNPATVDGYVDWDTSNEQIATVETDSQESTIATVTPTGKAGQVQISVTADADLGEGTKEIISTMDVEVVAGEAVAGTIVPVGEPQPIAPTATPRR